MNEQHLQDRFLLPYLRDGLGYREVKANTVASSLIIEEDLLAFLSESSLNRKPFHALLKTYRGDRKALLADVIALIQERVAAARNMALCINANKSITLQGVKLHLFHPGDSVIHGNALFEENIFSVVPELSYKFDYHGSQIFSFRPDLTFFVNGLYLGYSELKSNYSGQSARKNGRGKVIKDYCDAVAAYQRHIDSNAMLGEREKLALRKEMLKIFEKAIHITSTDIGETYVIRTLADYFDDMLTACRAGRFDREEIENSARAVFKPYPLLAPDAEKHDKLKELFSALYGRAMIEKEILYYNFLERDVYVRKGVKDVKNEPGRLIAPRPKQKFGTDKILAKIDELLAHEQEPDYFEKLLDAQLAGVGAARKKELLEKRRAYSNNKNVYSLLMQYAAGFGKSNIIGWSALQLKDLRRPDSAGTSRYVYDKVMIVVDRLQLRSQIDSLLLNMNIDRRLVIEAVNRRTFEEALRSERRIVIVNLQKFGALREMLSDATLQRLAGMRIVFLIDEIHRSNSGDQHEEMISIFDELQSPFDTAAYVGKARKKNLIIGFTATPDDRALARFGEFGGYAEHEKLWRPFDSYTMQEAIDDGFILNPLQNIVPVASKMLFDLPKHALEGFGDKAFKDAQKQQVYENRERIDAIAEYVANLLVKDVYRQIRGYGKAMLAVYSIKAAIAYHDAVSKHFRELVKLPKYAKYAKAPIHIVYSANQAEQSPQKMNGGLTEEKALQNFAREKNGLMIVVAKLQTGFDEKKLHTLFLDKEIRGISAIQTISRVNRKMKNKHDCKIVDFSYNNVNVQNIKDAFEHFSDVVVSDFDPFGDKKVLDVLLTELKKSNTFKTFFDVFTASHSNPAARNQPGGYLDIESRLTTYIKANPEAAADSKAKAAQYFTILNRIEYVIALETKYSEPAFLEFWRAFNTLYNLLHRSAESKDPISVYFDNQIGIVEPPSEEPQHKETRAITVADGGAAYTSGGQLDILALIAARNEHEAETESKILEFKTKILDFFRAVRESKEGKRLIVKMKSQVSEHEIYDDFAKIYRHYKALHRRAVGEYFFKETEDLVDMLCDNFEATLRADASPAPQNTPADCTGNPCACPRL